MNVLLFSDSDVFAGTERHMLDLAAGLRDLDVRVTIACPRPGALAQRADAAQVQVLAIAKRGPLDRAAVRALAERLTNGHADILHAHNGRTHILAAAAVRRARRGACIVTQHFLAPARTSRRGPAAWMARHLHRRAHAVTSHTIAISHAVRQAAINRGDAPSEAITTVHNGIAPPASPATTSCATREGLGLAAGTPLIFCAARLQVEKDLPTLLAAMPEVLKKHPTAHCLIAGAGDQRSQLEGQIESLNIGSRTRLLGFRDDISALLNACDLFVLPSAAEPFGLVLLEAMALAKPVVATRAGGPPEIVADGQTGLLVPPHDGPAMAHAIGELLAHPDTRRAFGAAGHRRYVDYFTIARMAREVRAIYDRALCSIKKGTYDH